MVNNTYLRFDQNLNYSKFHAMTNCKILLQIYLAIIFFVALVHSGTLGDVTDNVLSSTKAAVQAKIVHKILPCESVFLKIRQQMTSALLT